MEKLEYDSTHMPPRRRNWLKISMVAIALVILGGVVVAIFIAVLLWAVIWLIQKIAPML